ncbi:TOMM precursor leader peptide-binding protein [Flexivirga caeni]|uniref:TOMM leader peptide-binding protein n=1 Tax=Flexivirga caeni TaxID=2294115 RepID=A0A3M9M786_9MICO|nr:TOMM precursor leader peptide-binding protein [Flexivirga caeni]RNI21077.1 hypothetical protein EFY87_12390 [Flexivirga caeni]
MTTQPTTGQPPQLPDRVAVRRHGPGAVLVTGPRPGGLVLSGLAESEATAVLRLGTAARNPRPAYVYPAPSDRWSGVLMLVHQAAERLMPEPSARSRPVVLGDGPLPEEIRRALTPIVQRVAPEAEALAALHADAVLHPPDLAVIPALDAVPALTGRPWHAKGIRQLPVVVSGDRLTVGPLVRPGTGPCLNCLDLHRSARDPNWASWQAFRAGMPDGVTTLDAAPELLAAAAALTAFIVSGQQRGRPLPPGVSLSMDLPHPRIRHHLWTQHPGCCGASDVHPA